MNIAFASRCLVCCIALAAQSSIAYGQDISIPGLGDKSSPKAIGASNEPPLDPIPEPSAGSLILLSLGGVALGMKLRKQQHLAAVRSRV
jgi:hypothetical protein